MLELSLLKSFYSVDQEKDHNGSVRKYGNRIDLKEKDVRNSLAEMLSYRSQYEYNYCLYKIG